MATVRCSGLRRENTDGSIKKGQRLVTKRKSLTFSNCCLFLQGRDCERRRDEQGHVNDLLNEFLLLGYFGCAEHDNFYLKKLMFLYQNQRNLWMQVNMMNIM